MGLYRTIIEEIRKGKSLGRTLFNYELKTQKCGGRILDLGSGSARPSYYRFLSMADDSEVVTANISLNIQPDILCDLESPFPLKSKSFECVFVFNLLEHVYDYRNLLKETYRVLEDNGKLYGAVPFMVNVHPDPYDYFRYTDTALLKLLKEVGFKHIKIKPFGLGPFAVLYGLIGSFIPQIFRLTAVFSCIFFDKLFSKIFSADKNKYPLGYLFMCKRI